MQASPTANLPTTFKTPAALGAHDIRTVMKDGEPWFVVMDIARALGSQDATGTTRGLAADEKGLNVVHTPGGPQRLATVSESGLYRILIRSNSPLARPMQDWVTRIVLPAIRKDGAYIVGEEKVASGEMHEDEFLAKAWGILQAKAARVTAERDAALAANVVLTAHNTIMADELNNVTIAEWVALSHLYTDTRERGRLSGVASRLAVMTDGAVRQGHTRPLVAVRRRTAS